MRTQLPELFRLGLTWKLQTKGWVMPECQPELSLLFPAVIWKRDKFLNSHKGGTAGALTERLGEPEIFGAVREGFFEEKTTAK